MWSAREVPMIPLTFSTDTGPMENSQPRSNWKSWPKTESALDNPKDHIRQLEKDGVIEVDTIEPSEATDNVQHLVFVFGTCFKGRERWFIDEVFSGSNDKDGNFRPRRNDK